MTKKTQIDKFREAARDHEADENEETFNAALRAVTTNKKQQSDPKSSDGKPKRPR